MSTIGQEDAARVEEVIAEQPAAPRIVPPPRRAPSPPPRKAGRKAVPRPARAGEPATAPAPAEEISVQEREFWGRQLKGIADTVRAQRPWLPEFSDELAGAAGEPMALTVRKYMPSAEERPELVLLMVLTPWVIACVRAEAEHVAAARAQRAAAAGARRERGAVREEGQRQDIPGTETLGTPLALPDSRSPEGVRE